MFCFNYIVFCNYSFFKEDCCVWLCRVLESISNKTCIFAKHIKLFHNCIVSLDLHLNRVFFNLVSPYFDVEILP